MSFVGLLGTFVPLAVASPAVADGPVATNEAQPREPAGILAEVAARVRLALAEPGASSEPMPAADAFRLALVTAYAPRGFSPLWFAGGQPTRAAMQALDVLDRAPEWGLRPDDYRASELRAQLDRASSRWPDGEAPPAEVVGDPTFPARLASADVGLSLALSRFLAHLASGRVDPQSLDINVGPPVPAAPVTDLLELARTDRVDDAIRRAEPVSPLHARLKTALAATRGLLDTPALPPLQLPSTLNPGDTSDALAAVTARLRLWGDLVEDVEVTSRYEGEIVEAVRRFQARHGLEPDGVIGANTFTELIVPPEERVVQLELALERLRWLTRIRPGRVILANVAAFEAQGFDRFPEADPDVVMRIVAGNADRTPTPLFTGTLRTVVFRPYWYPPRSILSQELLPALRKDPEYFDKNDFEIVAAELDETGALPLTPESLADVQAGTLRVRQRPGAKNALGSVKFMFPNRHSVYMHDTPARSLFARARRDFSHGCIRLGSPLALAEFALRGSGDWDAARVLAASQGDATLNVTVKDDIQVVVFYMTADVTAEGRPRFFRDIYSHDPPLLARLAWLDR